MAGGPSVGGVGEGTCGGVIRKKSRDARLASSVEARPGSVF